MKLILLSESCDLFVAVTLLCSPVLFICCHGNVLYAAGSLNWYMLPW